MAHEVWKQFSTNLDNFLKIDINDLEEKVPNTLNSWQGMNKAHLLEILNEIRLPLDFISKNQDVFEKLPFNIANGLNSQVNSSVNQLKQLAQTPNQNALNNAINNTVSLRANLFTQKIGADLERQTSLSRAETQVAETIERLKETSDQMEAEKQVINQLKSEVQLLIEPAVSGSLSKTFKDRAAFVRKYRFAWLAVIFGFAIWTIYSTGVFVSEAMDVLMPSKDNVETGITDMRMGMVLLIRGGLLVPLTFLLVYSIKNARLERQFEEEYEHKSSVATALPNYADLISDDEVKNQILTQAADIIFQLPNQKKERVSKGKKENVSIEAVNELVSNITTIVKPKAD